MTSSTPLTDKVGSPVTLQARRGKSAAVRTRRIAAALTVWLGVIMLAIFGVHLIYGATHGDRVFEGVHVGPVRLAGMTEVEAAAALTSWADAWQRTPLQLSTQTESIATTPGDIGYRVDIAATVDSAMNAGRSGGPFTSSAVWVRGMVGDIDVDPVLVVNDRVRETVLSGLAQQVALAPTDAGIDTSTSDGPVIIPGVDGLAVDLSGTIRSLDGALPDPSTRSVAFVVRAVPPAITTDSLKVAALPTAESLIGQTLTISGVDRSWIVSTKQRGTLVLIDPVTGHPTVQKRAALALLRGIATDLQRPPEDARIRVNAEGDFEVVPAIVGVDVDMGTASSRLTAALLDGSTSVELPIQRLQPQITDAIASGAMASIEKLVAGGIRLEWSDGSTQLARDRLVAAVTIEPRPGESPAFLFGFDATVLESIIAPLADEIDIAPGNVRYRLVNGEIKAIGDAADGRALDLAGATADIEAAVLDGKTRLKLPVVAIKVGVTNEVLESLTFNDVLASASTTYASSSSPRRTNVERAVALQDGWLVAPGDTFSYNDNIGDITEETGFVTGFGIVSDGEGGVTTSPVIGGGICQVSTTIFQAVFWAGLTVTERWTHPYWLNGYGIAPSGMEGLDAMVNIDTDFSLDFKFVNNTDDWIAVRAIADGSNVIIRILGTDNGWSVNVDGPYIANVVEPPSDTLYTESTEIAPGTQLQVETAGNGFDVEIFRTVTKDGVVVSDDTFGGTYAPSRTTVLTGIG